MADVLKFIVEKGPEILAALNAVLMALIALFLLVPGEQPEKTIQKVADFLGKFSRKPKAPEAPAENTEGK